MKTELLLDARLARVIKDAVSALGSPDMDAADRMAVGRRLLSAAEAWADSYREAAREMLAIADSRSGAELGAVDRERAASLALLRSAVWRVWDARPGPEEISIINEIERSI